MQQSSEQDGDENEEEGDIYMGGMIMIMITIKKMIVMLKMMMMVKIYMVTSGRPVTVSAVITGIMDIHHIPGGRKGGNQWR